MGEGINRSALKKLFQLLESWATDIKFLLNIVIAEKDRIVATRHAINGDCPSLYYCVDEESFPGAKLVASEPLTESTHWQTVPEYHLLVLHRNKAPHLGKL